MDSARLRTAVPADDRALAEVHVACWRAAYADLMPAELLAGLSVDERQQGWRTILAENAASVVLAEIDGRLVGFAFSGTSRDDDRPDAGELYAIYTLPDAWGQGIGHALHEWSVDHLAAAGHSSALLWVLSGNRRATRFYRRQGWAPDGVRKVVRQGGADLPHDRYVRSLRPPAP